MRAIERARCDRWTAARAFGLRVRQVRAESWALAGLVAYGGILLATRPAAPFEWDEVLFQRGVESYDVARHAPHPPGYPAFVGMAKAVNHAVADPHLALQLVSIAAALAAVALTWVLARRLGGSRGHAAAAAALVATTPGFAFAAAVPMSDVTGTACALGAVVAALTAVGRPGLLPVAAAAAALAGAVRPQVAIVALVPLALATGAAMRTRRWRALAASVLAGVAVTAACWLPAICATGWPRFVRAVRDQAHWVAVAEARAHLPAAAPDAVLRAWLVGPFAGWEFAAPIWCLAAIGTAVLVWRRRGGATALCLGAMAPYLAFAARFMNLDLAVRYFLPVLPFAAVLATAGIDAARPLLRRSVGVLVVLWSATAAAWVSPAISARLRPGPVWATLAWVRAHYDPRGTRVVFDGVMRPQVQYVLGRAGFTLEQAPRPLRVPPDPVRVTLVVTPSPARVGELVHAERIGNGRVLQLAWHRYGSCAVVRLTQGLGSDRRPGPDGLKPAESR